MSQPTHVIVVIGTMDATGPGDEAVGVTLSDGHYQTITKDAVKNWTPNRQLSFGQAMCAVMAGYQVRRTGEVRVIQFHAYPNAIVTLAGQQSFTDFFPTPADMIAQDWEILDLALLGRSDQALPG